jgi:hypothetical protein
VAFIFLDGFDLYNGTGANTGLQSKWSNIYNSAGNFSLQTGRFSGQCAQVSGFQYGLGRPLGTTLTQCRISFALRCTTMPTAAAAPNHHMFLTSGGTYTFGLNIASNGTLSAYRATSATAGTLLGSSASAVILSNTWHWVEIEFVLHDTTGRVKVYVDGVAVITLTGQDTNNGVASFNEIGIGQAAGSGVIQWDDMSMDDSATALGADYRVETLYPTSDVAQGFARSTGATNYTLVDEAVVNGDTDYVQGSAVSDLDTYGFGDLSSTPSSIKAVQASAFAKKTDATSRSIALQVKSGATTSDGSNYALTASYAKLERLLETDPNTSAAWTGANVNAAQGGPKVTV